MGMLLGLSVDVSKIDKERLVKGKNGAQYLNLTVSVNDTVNEWGKDISVSESQSQEEREAKAEKKYLGNGKTLWARSAQTAKEKPVYGQDAQPAAASQPIAQQPIQDDLPF